MHAILTNERHPHGRPGENKYWRRMPNPTDADLMEDTKKPGSQDRFFSDSPGHSACGVNLEKTTTTLSHITLDSSLGGRTQASSDTKIID